MTPEHAEARAADQLNLRAHQLVVHGLTQGRDGAANLAAIFADVDTHRGAAEVFAAALGLLWRSLPADTAGQVAAELRGRIPALILRAEAGS